MDARTATSVTRAASGGDPGGYRHLRLAARPQSPRAPRCYHVCGRQPRPRVRPLKLEPHGSRGLPRLRSAGRHRPPGPPLGAIRGSNRISASPRIERAVDRPVRGRGQTLKPLDRQQHGCGGIKQLHTHLGRSVMCAGEGRFVGVPLWSSYMYERWSGRRQQRAAGDLNMQRGRWRFSGRFPSGHSCRGRAGREAEAPASA